MGLVYTEYLVTLQECTTQITSVVINDNSDDGVEFYPLAEEPP